MSLAPLGITCGDPGGVGPEIVARSLASATSNSKVVIYGDADILSQQLTKAGVPGERWVVVESLSHFSTATPPLVSIGLVHVGEWGDEARRHEASAAGGEAQYRCLQRALADAKAGSLRGLVTGPMSKEAVNLAGHEFVGHTEFLAAGCGLADDDVTMMFLGPRLRVALVTTHLAVRAVPDAITPVRVARSARHLGEALLQLDGPSRPRGIELLVTGLNPHAGEHGLFGDEDRLAIAPGIEQARAHPPFSAGLLQLRGPVPAETAIRMAAAGDVAGVVTMMHDQATIASKALDWGSAVNVTWGLPFVRTSVDHGVGYDAARSGQVDAQGMLSALLMAEQLTCAAALD